MDVFLAGVRGSMPTVGSEFSEFGGDTSCYAFRSGGQTLLIDAGSGLKHIPAEWFSSPVHVLFTHYHIDHLLGLLTCDHLYDRESKWIFTGPEFDSTPEQALACLFHPPLWPVRLQEQGGRFTYQTLPAHVSMMKLAGFDIRWVSAAHPGGSIAYRVSDENSSCVLMTDMEWQACAPEKQAELLDLIRTPGPADLLLLDAPYHDELYRQRTGWGHSSHADLEAIQPATSCKQLRIIHHDPAAEDPALRQQEKELSRRYPNVQPARQGELLHL